MEFSSNEVRLLLSCIEQGIFFTQKMLDFHEQSCDIVNIESDCKDLDDLKILYKRLALTRFT